MAGVTVRAAAYEYAADLGVGLEAQRRTRTGDPFLTMEVLYQLS
jgi:hypothetical protein